MCPALVKEIPVVVIVKRKKYNLPRRTYISSTPRVHSLMPIDLFQAVIDENCALQLRSLLLLRFSLNLICNGIISQWEHWKESDLYYDQQVASGRLPNRSLT